MIYTIRDEATGRSYDLELDQPIQSLSAGEIERLVAQQDAQRSADRAEVQSRVAAATALPRGSAERAAEMVYRPTEIPSVGRTTALELGSALSRIVPDVARSTLMLRESTGGMGLAGYGAESIARAIAGLPIEDPLTGAGRLAERAQQGEMYRHLSDISNEFRDYYDYDRTNVPEEQQALSRMIGGGIGSALGYAATIPAGGAALFPMSIGQTMAPRFEEMRGQGVTPGRAFTQAGLEGLIEGASEFALGLPGKIARRLGLAPESERLLKPLTDRVDQVVRTWVGEMGLGMTQEGVEEMISGLASDLSAAYVTGADPNALDNMLSKRLEEFAGGAIGGAVLGPAARQARQIQERRKQAQAQINQLRDQLVALVTDRQRRAGEQSMAQQGLPPVMPQAGTPALPGLVEGMGGAPGEESLPITGIAEAIARANTPAESNVAMPTGMAPADQDLPYDLLTQINRPPLESNVGMPTGQAPAGQDLPYDLLTQLNRPTLESNVGMPTGMAPAGQDLPYDLLSQLAAPPTAPAAEPQATRPTRSGRTRRMPGYIRGMGGAPTEEDVPVAPAQPTPANPPGFVSLEDEEAMAAEAERQEAAKQPPPQKGKNAEVQRKGREEDEVAAPLVAAPSVAIPTQAELEEAAAVAAEPPILVGLDKAENVKDHIKIARRRITEIKREKSAARREKLASDLMEEHLRTRGKFLQGRKSKALSEIEVAIAQSMATPDQAWRMLELAIDSDLTDRQQKWLDENLTAIGDVPGPDASPEVIQEYEAAARMPGPQLAYASANDSVSPWADPSSWLDYLATSHRPGEKRQLTSRHVFVQVDGKIWLMPVYDTGNSKLIPSKRIIIGDPEAFGMGRADGLRINLSQFRQKYGNRAKYLGTVRLPLSAASEWYAKTEWSPEEFQTTVARLAELQEDAIRSHLYPSEGMTEDLPTTTEGEGQIDASFMQQLAAREPAMAHILDFVQSFAADDPPIFGNDSQIKRWVHQRFDAFVASNEDARAIINQVVSIMMRSAIVRETGKGVQNVGDTFGIGGGLPIKLAVNPYEAKRWFKDQLVQAVLADIRANQATFAQQLAASLKGTNLRFEAGDRERALSAGAREGVASQLASRIAPALGVSREQLRSRGLRASEPGDYARLPQKGKYNLGWRTVRKLTLSERQRAIRDRARKLNALRKLGHAVPLSEPSPVQGRTEADLRQLQDRTAQASAELAKGTLAKRPDLLRARSKVLGRRASVSPAPQVQLPATAPALRWRQLKDSSGYPYWVAASNDEFNNWLKNYDQARSAIQVRNVGGATGYATYVNPAQFTRPQVKAKAAKQSEAPPIPVTGRGMMISPDLTMPENATPEEIMAYQQAVMARMKSPKPTKLGAETAERLVRLGVEALSSSKRSRFLGGNGTAGQWVDLLSDLVDRHSEFPAAELDKIEEVIQKLASYDQDALVPLQSESKYETTILGLLGVKKKASELRVMAAQPLPETPAEVVSPFWKAFKKLGGDRSAVDTQMKSPAAIQLEADGTLTLVINPERLAKLSNDQWSVIWDEELRHTALLAFARQRLKDSQFVGDFGAKVAQQLAEAWGSIDGPARTLIEDRLAKIYGKLTDTQRTVELVRMVGQNVLTEQVTKKSLGQRFLDLIRDFAGWLREKFRTNAPRPIQDLIDGSERLLNMVESEPVPVDLSERRWIDWLADENPNTVEAAEMRVSAAPVDSRLDNQLLTKQNIDEFEQSGNLETLGKRRLAEREAAWSDMLDQDARDLLKELDQQTSAPVASGTPPSQARILRETRAAAVGAWNKVRSLRDLSELQNRLSAPSLGQQVLAGMNPTLDDDQRAEVMHDVAGVVAAHERLESDLNTLNNQLLARLHEEAMALKRLSDFLGTTGKSPEVMKDYIKGVMNSFRSDVVRAMELSQLADERQMAKGWRQNIPTTANLAAMQGAMRALGQKGAIDQMKYLLELLANHPQLDLSTMPVDPDQFYQQLTTSQVWADVMQSGNLTNDPAILAATTTPAPGIRPPLQVWGGLRNTIEELKGYKEVHAQALADLQLIAKDVDPLANIPRDKAISNARALRRFQDVVRKNSMLLHRLKQYDTRLRNAWVRRRAVEQASEVLSSVMNGKNYQSIVHQAVSFFHRRANDVIYDVAPKKDERPGTIAIIMPPDADGNREVRKFQLSFESQETDAAMMQLQRTLDDIEAWLATNPKDPILAETYRSAAKHIEGYLNPNYAISSDTIMEGGLWGLLQTPFNNKLLRDFLHPVLREIDDGGKGLAKGVLTKAMAPFVRWGLFEQGLKPDVVKIKAAKMAGLKSHGLVAEFSAKHILRPFEMDRQDDAYRWTVIEPIIRSWQNSLGKQLEAGMYVPDAQHLISGSGWVQLTKEDIEAARAQVAYEKKVRKFTTDEGFGLPEGAIRDLEVTDQTPSGAVRTRLPFAPGQGVMSRSLSHKASGPAMQLFQKIRIQIPESIDQNGKTINKEAIQKQLTSLFLRQVLRGGLTGGQIDEQTWQDVVLSHVMETNPEYQLRYKSPLRKVYDSIAQDLMSPTSTLRDRLSNAMNNRNAWNELVAIIAERMPTILGSKESPAERVIKAENTLAAELTQGMDNVREIMDEQARGSLSDIHVLSPKSSFVVARGNLVGPPGLYEYGLHSDFAINALHGTVLRHVSDNLLKAMEVMGQALDQYIEKYKETDVAQTLAGRKFRGEVAYRLNEAIRLQKAIKDQISVMRVFEEATRDPEQYYHDIMRWGSMLLVRPLVSAVANPFSVLKDTALTLSVGITRQRRSLWDTVNWWFTTPKAVGLWFQSLGTVVAASFARTPAGRRSIRRAIVSLSPTFGAIVHNAANRMAQMRLDGIARGVSMADEQMLMRTSGSLLGVMGAMEYEKTRPLLSKVIKVMDRIAAGGIPGVSRALRGTTYLIGETRTIAEDINSMMFAAYGDSDLTELTLRAMEALRAREAMGRLDLDPTDPGYAFTEQELRMSFGGLRQARRWMEGSGGLERAMIAHYKANKGLSPREMAKKPIDARVRQAWIGNYVTDSQVQTLRDRPAVAFKKGLGGRIARSFGTFKVWSSQNFANMVTGEILRTRPNMRRFFRMPDEVARMVAMLAFFILLGAPSLVAVDWLKSKLGKTQGLTIENLMESPDWQMAFAMMGAAATQTIPMGGIVDDLLSGFGTGSFDIANLNVIFSGATGFYRAFATIANTSDLTDPKSVVDATAYQMRSLAMRHLPITGYGLNMIDPGLRQYSEAGAAVRALVPSDVERSAGRATIPKSPAYDNIRRAIQLDMAGKTDEARAEIEEGVRQVVASGVAPDMARKKVQAAVAAQSVWRLGFERSLTDEEKLKTVERATTPQKNAILSREEAVSRLSAMLRKPGGGGGYNVGGGGNIRLPQQKRLAAISRIRRQTASPSAQYMKPLRLRRRPASGLARLRRLRQRLGLAGRRAVNQLGG